VKSWEWGVAAGIFFFGLSVLGVLDSWRDTFGFASCLVGVMIVCESYFGGDE
jgi:hypothetical protein